MMRLAQRHFSLYAILGAFIFVAVALVMFVQARYSYVVMKEQTLDKMQAGTHSSILSLQSNMASLMEAYAVNEYEHLVRTEVERQGHYAIIIEDINMAQIVGEAAYVSGKIRDDKGRVVDFDPLSVGHRVALERCMWVQHGDILSSNGVRLGSISIYNTDEAMNRELQKIVISNLIEAVGLSVLAKNAPIWPPVTF